MLGSLSGPSLSKPASKCPFAKGKFTLEQFQRALKEHPDNPFQALQELHQEQGETFEFSSPEGKFVFDQSPKTARKLLLRTEGDDSQFKKSPSQTHGLAQVLGRENVLLSSGAQWQTSREALEPFFSARNVRTDANMLRIAKTLDKHFDKIDEKLDQQDQVSVDIYNLFQKATLDVALNQIFSSQVPDQGLEKLCAAYDVLNERVGREWLIPASLSGLEAPDEKHKEALSTVNNWAQALVTERTEMEQRPNDALTALMGATDPETGEPFSYERLVSEVQNLMLAGHETTANLLSWIVADLARSPGEQKQLASQVKEAFQTEIPKRGELHEVPSLRKVWREQAIEHPPNYLLARVATEDTTIGPKDNPIPIEAGTTVMVNTQEANNGGPMLSFGGGERFCLGFNLARLETELAVARFLQRFKVSDTGARGVQSSLAQAPMDTEVTIKRRTLIKA